MAVKFEISDDDAALLAFAARALAERLHEMADEIDEGIYEADAE